MNVNEAIEYIHSVYWAGSTPGLYRVQELLAKMGNPEKNLKFVHVAGTNGKGSTASMLASILRKAGYHTGLYTSPYIYRFHDRIQLDGEQIAASFQAGRRHPVGVGGGVGIAEAAGVGGYAGVECFGA